MDKLADKIAAIEDEDIRAVLELLLERLEELEERQAAPPIKMGSRTHADR